MQNTALILGGGSDQTLLVKEFKRRGWRTIVMDYYPNPPACREASLHCQKSCYDENAALELARKHRVQLISTICTDQPLLVASYVSEKLNLFSPINSAVALRLTNKQYMKEVLRAHGIPTPHHIVFGPNESPRVHQSDLNYPLVIKPTDSSGSRGVSVIHSACEIEEAIKTASNYTRCDSLIAEEFVAGYEVSVDAFVINGTTYTVMISDNYKVKEDGKSALAARSQYPSRMHEKLRKHIEDIIQELGIAFQLDNVPLFVQLLVQKDKIFVMELSARLAGGSKPLFIKTVTGIDVVQAYVSMLLGEPISMDSHPSNSTVVVHYVYCSAGVIQAITGFEEALEKGLICWFSLYREPGDHIHGWDHGGDRVAAYAIRRDSPEEVRRMDELVEQEVRVLGTNGEDMIIRGLHY